MADMRNNAENSWWRGLAEALELPVRLRAVPVAGGSIASSWRLEADGRRWFLKLMPAGGPLAAEADGLHALAQPGWPRVPTVLGQGCWQDSDWLLLEWLDLTSPDGAAWRRLGEQLAALHDTETGAFGWRRDNFIGTTPQPNGQLAGWRDFFRERRLGHQIRLARGKGLGEETLETLERLCDSLGALLPSHIRPSLLHGDLWSGNIAAVGRDPVIFDPAVYGGHHEADLAMMELFGTPPADFWSAYEAHRPVEPEYRVRRDLYNLYHLLNHFNLFGGGYGDSAGRVARRLLAEAGA